MIINLISNPRNLSTALMYSFAQRKDTKVIDEPFYGVYLKQTGLQHPGRDLVLQHLPISETAVDDLINKAYTTPHLFLKNMAHHIMLLQDRSWMHNCVNLLYVRHPRYIVASFSKVIEKPTIQDIGIKDQYMLWQYLNKNELPYWVLDSALLQTAPKETISATCAALGLPFDQNMLAWPQGKKEYDGVWWPWWYANVHQSTGFEKSNNREPELSGDLQRLVDESIPLYEEILQHPMHTIRP